MQNRDNTNSEAVTPQPGDRFNPHHTVCGFYPPDVVGHDKSLNLTQGQKRLYERAVRWAGKNNAFWWSLPNIAEALGRSVRQIKHDVAILEEKRLIGHIRR